jgi:GntR family transcriptional regulator
MPLYVAVYDVIYGLIANGELKEGDQIPTENFFAEYLSVSRSTVRMALLVLQEDGLLYTQHGKGTFVGKINRDSGLKMSGLNLSPKNIIQIAGKEYSSSEGSFRMVTYDNFLASKLNPASDEKVGLVSQVHLADGEPVALSQSFFIAREDFLKPNLSFDKANQMLDRWIKQKKNRIEYTFAPVVSTEDKKDLLGVGQSKALLLIRCEVFGDGRRFVFSKDFYNTSRIDISLTTEV